MRLHTLLATAAIAAIAFTGCKKNEDGQAKPEATDPTQKPVEAPEATPKAMTGEELSKHLLGITDAINSRDMARVGAFYADNATVQWMDFVAAPGREAPMAGKISATDWLKGSEEYYKAFPDSKGETSMVLVSGQEAVLVGLSTGTNTGDFMGMPKTDKKVGLRAVHHLQTGPDGKIVEDTVYMDQASFSGQLGMMPEGMYRPAVELTGEPAVVAVAGDTDAERKNVETVKAFTEAFNSHDVAKVVAFYGDTGVYSDQSMAGDLTGAEAITQGLTGYYGMTSDAKAESQWMWGAGDFVAAGFVATGTHDGDMAGGAVKATGKTFRLHQLGIFQLKDGKIAHHWVFANSLSAMQQLDLLPPMAPPAADSDEKAAK